MTTRSATRTINSYRFTSNDKVAQNLTKRKSIIGALQGFGKPDFRLEYLVVGGGGAGGSAGGGGGGGGGVVIGTMGFTDNPLYSGFSATASLYYQRSPGTGRCEMQVTAVGSGYLQPGSVIDIPGVSTNMPVIIYEQRSGTPGGIGNYSVSTVLTAPTAPTATAQPTATPPAFALTPRTVTGTSGIAYGTPIGVTIGAGGGGRTDAIGNLGSQSNFGFITAHGGGGGGSAGLPSNTDARGTGSATSVASGGGQGAFYGFTPSSPYGFVAGSVQGGYGGVSFRPGADNDVRNGRSGYDRGEDNPFPGFPGPTETIDRNAQPYALIDGIGGGGGGAGGWDRPAPNSDNESRGGSGGGGTVWPYTGARYASGGGGSSFQPTNNPADAGGDEAGRGTVYNGGDEMFNGGTAPTGAPLPPYGSKIGFGGPNGESPQNKRALRNRGGGGGGAYNGGSYFSFPATIRLGVGPLSPFPYPGGLGGASVWPADYDYGNPGSPTWRGRNSGSEGGSGGSGVVIIRYPQVFGNVSNSGSPDVSVTPTGFIHYTFTGSGSITFDYNP
jgi:hypothetical protein